MSETVALDEDYVTMVEIKFTVRVLDYYEWARRAAARRGVELSFEDFINFRIQEHYIRCLGLTG